VAAYATQADAIELYGDQYVTMSVDRDDDGRIDADALTQSLADGQSELDSYIGVKYNLPLVTVPAVLKRFTVDVAIYISSNTAGSLTDEKTERYKAAIKWARDVAKGGVSLGLDDEPPTVGGGVSTSGPTRIMTRSTMSGIL